MTNEVQIGMKKVEKEYEEGLAIFKVVNKDKGIQSKLEKINEIGLYITGRDKDKGFGEILGGMNLGSAVGVKVGIETKGVTKISYSLSNSYIGQGYVYKKDLWKSAESSEDTLNYAKEYRGAIDINVVAEEIVATMTKVLNKKVAKMEEIKNVIDAIKAEGYGDEYEVEGIKNYSNTEDVYIRVKNSVTNNVRELNQKGLEFELSKKKEDRKYKEFVNKYPKEMREQIQGYSYGVKRGEVSYKGMKYCFHLDDINEDVITDEDIRKVIEFKGKVDKGEITEKDIDYLYSKTKGLDVIALSNEDVGEIVRDIKRIGGEYRLYNSFINPSTKILEGIISESKVSKSSLNYLYSRGGKYTAPIRVIDRFEINGSLYEVYIINDKYHRVSKEGRKVRQYFKDGEKVSKKLFKKETKGRERDC